MVSKRKLKSGYKIVKKLGKAVVVLIGAVVALLLLVLLILFWEDLWQLVKPLVDEIWPYLQDLAEGAVNAIFEQQ
jgi:hypothetical protein